MLRLWCGGVLGFMSQVLEVYLQDRMDDLDISKGTKEGFENHWCLLSLAVALDETNEVWGGGVGQAGMFNAVFGTAVNILFLLVGSWLKEMYNVK